MGLGVRKAPRTSAELLVTDMRTERNNPVGRGIWSSVHGKLEMCLRHLGRKTEYVYWICRSRVQEIQAAANVGGTDDYLKLRD